jgi:hypothetical protein
MCLRDPEIPELFCVIDSDECLILHSAYKALWSSGLDARGLEDQHPDEEKTNGYKYCLGLSNATLQPGIALRKLAIPL